MPPPCRHEQPRPDACHWCRIARDVPHYAAQWGGGGLPSCRHLGTATGETVDCPSCAGRQVRLKVFSCAVHGRCTPGRKALGLACCAGCPDRDSTPVAPSLAARFDERNLAPGVPGKRMNGSLIEEEGGYLLAFRTGWKGSDIHLIRLGRDLAPRGEAWRLDLKHPEADYGREDPRLFRHGGAVHVSFTGVVGGKALKHTSVLYARLTPDLRVERVFYPHYPARNPWEKNWQFFSHDGALYASYSITPHRVLRIDGDRAELAHSTPFMAPWEGGEMRGGAAPVLVGDEFWCFFHDRIERGGRRVYRAGLWAFEAAPPFRPTRYLPVPVLAADPRTKPADQYAAVVWPGGAVRAGDDWLLAVGAHDRWQEVHRFSHAALESRLQRISPPAWWRAKDDDARSIWASVCGRNEYRLPADMSGMVCLDVGAHVGSFAAACLERGAALVHCYEPSAESLPLLHENLLSPCLRRPGGGMADVYAWAVGPCEGRASYEAGRSDWSAGAFPDGEGGLPMTSLDAAVRRLLAESGRDRVDVLKLDCEGCEHGALAAFTLWGKIGYLALEYHGGPGVLPALLRGKGLLVEVGPGPSGWGLMFARRP